VKEILFRAWDDEIEAFVYSNQNFEDYWFEFDKGKLKAFAIHGMTAGDYYNPPEPDCVDLEEPQQYTGLRDKNGVRIFEGDIVAASIYRDEEPQVLEVEFRNGAFVIDYEDADSDVVNVGDFVGTLEIIGNIFENPELLEG
jgi:uncharacterized phage protein (TIGR01671 family)